MPPRSSYAFLAAGPLMLALAAFLAVPDRATAEDRITVFATVQATD